MFPNAERVKAMAAGAIAGLVIFGLITLGFIIGIWVSRDVGQAAALGFPLVLFGIIFLACAGNFYAKSVNAIIFRLRQGGHLHLWFEKPEPKSFQIFCQTLTKKAEEAWNNRPADSTRSLAGEINALKKLVESGALSEVEFQRAKDKLINPAADVFLASSRHPV